MISPFHRILRLTGVAATCLLLAGCAGSRRAALDRPALPSAFPNHSAEQIHALLTMQADTVTAFTARASLAVRTPEQDASLSATIHHRRGDSLYMSLSPGLGIEAARMLVTQDSFYVYDRIKKKLTYGSLDYAASTLPLPVGDDMFRALMGLSVPAIENAWSIETDQEHYILSDPTSHQRYIIDPTIWRVVRYEARTAAGALVEARTYSEFDTFHGLIIPRRVVLERPLDDTRASIYYRSLTFNPSTLAMALRVSGDAERILADDDNHGSPRR